jgi:hypothetical protein
LIGSSGDPLCGNGLNGPAKLVKPDGKVSTILDRRLGELDENVVPFPPQLDDSEPTIDRVILGRCLVASDLIAIREERIDSAVESLYHDGKLRAEHAGIELASEFGCHDGSSTCSESVMGYFFHYRGKPKEIHIDIRSGRDLGRVTHVRIPCSAFRFT